MSSEKFSNRAKETLLARMLNPNSITHPLLSTQIGWNTSDIGSLNELLLTQKGEYQTRDLDELLNIAKLYLQSGQASNNFKEFINTLCNFNSNSIFSRFFSKKPTIEQLDSVCAKVTAIQTVQKRDVQIAMLASNHKRTGQGCKQNVKEVFANRDLQEQILHFTR